MALLIGIDVGTTGAKSILMDAQGTIKARSFVEYPLELPQPGWAEQHPDTWVAATIQGLKELVQKSGLDSRSVKALSFSGQMHGLVCLDKTLRPLRKAILWCDQRTTKQCRAITRKLGKEKLRRWVFNPALEGFTLPKLLWVKENEPALYRRIHKLLLPKDYVRMRLCGELGMEYSDAAGTIMFDVKNSRWSTQMLDAFAIPHELLPPVFASQEVAGTLRSEIARECGLREKTKVVFGGADNACAAVGNGIIEEGILAVSIGTSGTVIGPTRHPRADQGMRIHLFNHCVPQLWYHMGVMQAAGLSLKWFRDNFGQLERAMEQLTVEDAYDLLSREAEQVQPGSEGLLWLPYLQGERTPHQDALARGALCGLTARHQRGHVIRALMEGVAFGLRNSLDIIKDLGVPIKELRLTGGGARSELWRQIQADVFGCEVETINVAEGPPFGAALIAGVGCGVYEDFAQACHTIIRVVEHREPKEENRRIYEELYHTYNSLYPSLRGHFHRLARLQA